MYRLGTPIFGKLFYNRYRQEAMSNAVGRLLMIGIGPGNDLSYLPPGAVVVPVIIPIKSGPGAAAGISLYTPVIVKYRDEKTDTAVRLEDLLR